MKQHTTEVKRTLDGHTIRATVPCYVNAELGPGAKVVTLDMMEVFDRHVAEQALQLGLSGPETFRFLRKHLDISMVRLAELFGVDRSTVHRWETGESELSKPAMVTLAQMARERMRKQTRTMDQLLNLGPEPPVNISLGLIERPKTASR